MSEKGIEVTIRPDGSTDFDMVGYTDNTCSKDVEKFLDILGGKVERKAKEGISQKNKNNVQQKRG